MRAAAGILGLLLTVACGGGGGGDPSPPPPPPPAPPPPPQPDTGIRFNDATEASGISYRHGYLLPTPASEPEEFGGGVASGDYDGDGLVDLFVLRGDIGPNLLYRNLGDNAFEEVGEAAGVAYTKSANDNYRHSGPAFADVDGDGDLDLFIGGIEFDPSFLFRNEGDGTFTDVTRGSGVDTVASRYTLSARLRRLRSGRRPGSVSHPLGNAPERGRVRRYRTPVAKRHHRWRDPVYRREPGGGHCAGHHRA